MAGQKKTPVKPIVPVYGYKKTKSEKVPIGENLGSFSQVRDKIRDHLTDPNFRTGFEALIDPHKGTLRNPVNDLKTVRDAGKELGRQIKRIPQQYRQYRINKRFKQMLPTQRDWRTFNKTNRFRNVGVVSPLMRMMPLVTSGISTLSQQIRENNQREMSNR